ncbi:tripeptidyl peptidase A [Exidia glandulosa HHB12029]|uniref:tripeptidyl-peptidase II n=1 Tax=Exidia glandulosa HHB12029 TaxID=1314781 RepID=A0A166BVR9_EXIGL|nr:tripeptidyl peptidase A [Exidia glandulosa HHB12029]
MCAMEYIRKTRAIGFVVVTMLLLRFAALLAAVSDSFALPSPRSLELAVKETFNAPRGWTKRSRAPAEHRISLRIGLAQGDFRALESALYDVSDPRSARYGQHLSKEAVEALVAPRPEAVNFVEEWLEAHACTDYSFSSAKDWVKLDVSVEQAERMLDTEFHVWQHADGREPIVRTTHYSLPVHLHEHVDVVQPTTLFAQLGAQRRPIIFEPETQLVDLATPAASCNTTITLQCLADLYNFTGYVPQAADLGNGIGITGYLEEHATDSDLQAFFAALKPEAVGFTFDTILVNNGTNPQGPTDGTGEASLDVQYAFGIAWPTPATFWSTGGRPPFNPDLGTPTNTNEPYLDWLESILALDSPPFSISTSYGEDEQTVPESFARRICADFAQLGARGVSLMFSSGDGGVGDGDANPATQTCITNDGLNTTKFMPGFPGSCPFVTAVGGTHFVPEVAVGFSGGGFSDYFERPAYQDEIVSAFLDTIPETTYAGLFNRSGRAIPDVSAQASRFAVFVDGRQRSISGTSASSPAFAGVVGLLNDVRIAAGKPPLGFLNPFLYSIGLAGFNDITSGNAPGCGTPGFNATSGWDPVTGFGTPDFAKLKELVLQI